MPSTLFARLRRTVPATSGSLSRIITSMALSTSPRTQSTSPPASPPGEPRWTHPTPLLCRRTRYRTHLQRSLRPTSGGMDAREGPTGPSLTARPAPLLDTNATAPP